MNIYRRVVSTIIISLWFTLLLLTLPVSAAELEDTASTETVVSESTSDEWLKVDAVITDITRKSWRNNAFLSIATVDYAVPSIGEISSRVDIVKIPFYGSLNSVWDTITVSYQESNPAILYTAIGKIIAEYGMYLLIVLWIIFSIKPMMQVIKRK